MVKRTYKKKTVNLREIKEALSKVAFTQMAGKTLSFDMQ